MRRVVLSSVVLVLLVLGAGCLGIGGEPDRTDSAEATLADVNSAIQDVRTYRAQTDLQATAVADGEEISRSATIVGEVNTTQKRSKTTLQMAGENRTVYLDNRTVYQECESPWGWANESVDVEGQWVTGTTLGRHVELLDSGDLRLETTDALADEGAVALVGHPSTEALEEYREESTQPAVGGPKIENVSVRLVVDNQTHRPVRGSMSFEAAGDGATATVRMQTMFSAYGDHIRISIPQNVTDSDFDWEGGCPGS